MITKTQKTLKFEDIKLNTKIKLAGLWTATMFLFVYADIQHFVLQPGSIQELLIGSIGGMETTPLFMFGASVLMTIPAMMIFLSLVLKPKLNRWINIIIASAFTLISLSSLVFSNGTWAYYLFYNVVEILLTGSIIWTAINWPKSKQEL